MEFGGTVRRDKPAVGGQRGVFKVSNAPAPGDVSGGAVTSSQSGSGLGLGPQRREEEAQGSKGHGEVDHSLRAVRGEEPVVE
jgi:hypothetical protein